MWSTIEDCLRFGILPRDAVDPEEMVWFECEGQGHIWHTISAWEEGAKIVLWAPKFDSYSNEVTIN